jgi:putative membrane protein
MTRLLLTATAALTLASCAGNMDYGNMSSPMARADGTPAASSMPPGMNLTVAMPYVAKAAASDLFEIQSSQIALQKAQNPNVRQFAQMLITHHTGTTQTLTAAARAAGLTPPRQCWSRCRPT